MSINVWFFYFGWIKGVSFIKWKQYLQRLLHVLKWQGLGFHTLISPIDSCKDLQFLIFWGTMAHIVGPGNNTDWIIHKDLYFCSVSLKCIINDLFYICVSIKHKHWRIVNNLFVEAMQKSFNEAARSSIQEYCGYIKVCTISVGSWQSIPFVHRKFYRYVATVINI